MTIIQSNLAEECYNLFINHKLCNIYFSQFTCPLLALSPVCRKSSQMGNFLGNFLHFVSSTSLKDADAHHSWDSSLKCHGFYWLLGERSSYIILPKTLSRHISIQNFTKCICVSPTITITGSEWGRENKCNKFNLVTFWYLQREVVSWSFLLFAKVEAVWKDHTNRQAPWSWNHLWSWSFSTYRPA